MAGAAILHGGTAVGCPTPGSTDLGVLAAGGSPASVCVATGAGVCRFLVFSVRGHRGRRVQAPKPQCACPQGQVCAGS